MFAIDFCDISLIELISDKESKVFLLNAKSSLKDRNYTKAMENCALAFENMIIKYESNKLTKYEESVFTITDDMTFLNSFYMGIDRSEIGDISSKLSEFIDKTINSIFQLQNTIKIMGYGIDFRKYALFDYLTPVIHHMLDGSINFGHHIEYTENNVNYCIDFCIDSFLKLIHFDFKLFSRK